MSHHTTSMLPILPIQHTEHGQRGEALVVFDKRGYKRWLVVGRRNRSCQLRSTSSENKEKRWDSVLAVAVHVDSSVVAFFWDSESLLGTPCSFSSLTQK
mmetsp:Transcript_9835/g.15780  ORF Transcript_9835/g.15780 Transcript_9835/m.15780 type:complete len:99 (+) Transcript_9835:136-432(+)